MTNLFHGSAKSSEGPAGRPLGSRNASESLIVAQLRSKSCTFDPALRLPDWRIFAPHRVFGLNAFDR
jgi:hypothetical protein